MTQDATPNAGETGQAPGAGETGQDPGTTDNGDPAATEGKAYDEKYVKELRGQAAAQRTRAKTAEERATAAEAELQKIRDRDKSEGEKLAERATENERRASEAEARALRYEIAAAKGLDLRSAGFLTGTTREEIEAKADELAALLTESKTSSASTGGFDGGARQTPATKRAPEVEHNDLLLRAFGRQPPTP